MEPLQAHPHAPARLCLPSFPRAVSAHHTAGASKPQQTRTLLRTRHHFNKENSQSGFLLFEIRRPLSSLRRSASLLAVANNRNNRHFSAVMTFRRAAMYSFVAGTRSIPWRIQRVSLGGGNRRAGTWRLAREHDAAAPFVLGMIERGIGAGGETVQGHAVSGCHCDADSDADAHVAPANHKRSAQRADNSMCK